MHVHWSYKIYEAKCPLDLCSRLLYYFILDFLVNCSCIYCCPCVQCCSVGSYKRFFEGKLYDVCCYASSALLA